MQTAVVLEKQLATTDATVVVEFLLVATRSNSRQHKRWRLLLWCKHGFRSQSQEGSKYLSHFVGK